MRTTKPKMPSLKFTWARQPRAKGLMGVGQGELGWHLRLKGERVGAVCPHYPGWSRVRDGYYTYGRSDTLGVPLFNTASKPVQLVGQAIAQAEKRISEALAGKYVVSFNRAALTKAGIEVPSVEKQEETK